MGNSNVFIGREDDVNEKGLAVAMRWVAPTRVAPGINFLLSPVVSLTSAAMFKKR